MKLLEVRNLDKYYFSRKKTETVHAVSQVSFCLKEGEFLGLVGESGCGKSTIAKMLIGLLKPDGGTISLAGEPLQMPFPKDIYRQMQMIFQLPRDSFDPRRRIGDCLIQVQRNFGRSREEAQRRVPELLSQVGLPPEFLSRYPHQLSGGECQRAAIARALCAEPRLLICDEITSALDVSIQAQIVELLLNLRRDRKLSLLFISHDLALVQGLCERILVMYQGEILEEGTGRQLREHPKQDYTRQLFASVYDSFA